MMRSSWTNPKALFLGFKLGSPSVEHGHMDVGSFVFDSDGVRWAMDFGQQEYESLESKTLISGVMGRTHSVGQSSVTTVCLITCLRLTTINNIQKEKLHF